MDLLSCFFLTSGLFLGWSMGANDAANLFGTAVGSRMVRFRTAALIASVFVILGAVMQGSGTTQTLTELGAVDAIGGAFTVALCSAIVVTLFVRYKIPVSTSQAIVGAIAGWCFFTSAPLNYGVLLKILSAWILSPLFGCIIAAMLYLFVRQYVRSAKIHVLKLEAIIRVMLIVACALSAYALGANNIANVMGIFVNSFAFSIKTQLFTISSIHLLFLLGGFAIALGIYTYSRRIIETIGSKVVKMTPLMAVVVVMTQAVVLLLFSSPSISDGLRAVGLPAIPLVPVSSTQIVVGALLGIGLVKGIQEIKFSMVGNIFISWIVTPLASAILTFFALFFVRHTFDIQVTMQETGKIAPEVTPTSREIFLPMEINYWIIALAVLLLSAIIYIIVLTVRNNRLRQFSMNVEADEQSYSDYRKALADIEVNAIKLENDQLLTSLEAKKQQLITYSLSIAEHRKRTEDAAELIKKVINTADEHEKSLLLEKYLMDLKQRISYIGEVDAIYLQAKNIHSSFIEKLNCLHPDLTDHEIKLLILLRIGLSSKEIAPLMNISDKSVDINRHRLRKKLKIARDVGLSDYAKTL
ncbi:MAG: inorganic phosphate transporter [Dysgonamonadaceae bacterium]|nr:inorganic phosphate transporter [Dysgonamonadaceae bacterium]